MKAIVQKRYGGFDVLELVDTQRPVPGPGEVLVRVIASSANPRDWHYMRGLPYIARPQIGIRAPKLTHPGSDIAGVVEELGPGTGRVSVDDEVYAYVESGGFSEFAAVPESALGRKPANLSFEQAGVVPLAATTALQGLRFGGLREGSSQRVMIVGASGGIGTFAVQIAKAWGAHVTGVCSTRNVDLVRALGADDVIDYTTGDFTAGEPRFDLVFQLGGTTPAKRLRRPLKPDGVLVLNSGDGESRWFGPFGRVISAKLLGVVVSQKIGTFEAKASGEDLNTIGAMLEAGQTRPVIERTVPLTETAAAIRQVETGHARGKLAISVQPVRSPSGVDATRANA